MSTRSNPNTEDCSAIHENPQDEDETTISGPPKVKAVHYYHNASYHSSQASCRTPTATAVTWKPRPREEEELEDDLEEAEDRSALPAWLPPSPHKRRKVTRDDPNQQQLPVGQHQHIMTVAPYNDDLDQSFFCYQGLPFASQNHIPTVVDEEASTIVASNRTKKGLSHSMKTMVQKLAKKVLISNKSNNHKGKAKDDVLKTPPRVFSHSSTPATWSPSPGEEEDRKPKPTYTAEFGGYSAGDESPIRTGTLFGQAVAGSLIPPDGDPIPTIEEILIDDSISEPVPITPEEREQLYNIHLQQQQMSTSATEICTTTILVGSNSSPPLNLPYQPARRNLVVTTVPVAAAYKHPNNKRRSSTGPVDLDETPPSSPEESFATLPPDMTGVSLLESSEVTTPRAGDKEATRDVGAEAQTTEDRLDDDLAMAMDLNNLTITTTLDGSFALQQHEVRFRERPAVIPEEDEEEDGEEDDDDKSVDLDITVPDDGSFVPEEEDAKDEKSKWAVGPMSYDESCNSILHQVPPAIARSAPVASSSEDTVVTAAQPPVPQRASTGHVADVDSTNESFALPNPQHYSVRQGPIQLANLPKSPQRRLLPPLPPQQKEMTPPRPLARRQMTPPRPATAVQRRGPGPVDLDDTIASSNDGSFAAQQQTRRGTGPVDLDDTIASSNNASTSLNGSDWVASSKIVDDWGGEGNFFFRQQRQLEEHKEALPSSKKNGKVQVVYSGPPEYSGPVEDYSMDDTLAWTRQPNFAAAAAPPVKKQQQQESVASSKRGVIRIPPSGRDSPTHFGPLQQSKSFSSTNTVVLQHMISHDASEVSTLEPDSSTDKSRPLSSALKQGGGTAESSKSVNPVSSLSSSGKKKPTVDRWSVPYKPIKASTASDSDPNMLFQMTPVGNAVELGLVEAQKDAKWNDRDATMEDSQLLETDKTAAEKEAATSFTDGTVATENISQESSIEPAVRAMTDPQQGSDPESKVVTPWLRKRLSLSPKKSKPEEPAGEPDSPIRDSMPKTEAEEKADTSDAQLQQSPKAAQKNVATSVRSRADAMIEQRHTGVAAAVDTVALVDSTSAGPQNMPTAKEDKSASLPRPAEPMPVDQVKPKPFDQRPQRPPPPSFSATQGRLSALWEEPRSRSDNEYTGPVDLDVSIAESSSSEAYRGPVDVDAFMDSSGSDDSAMGPAILNATGNSRRFEKSGMSHEVSEKSSNDMMSQQCMGIREDSPTGPANLDATGDSRGSAKSGKSNQLSEKSSNVKVSQKWMGIICDSDESNDSQGDVFFTTVAAPTKQASPSKVESMWPVPSTPSQGFPSSSDDDSLLDSTAKAAFDSPTNEKGWVDFPITPTTVPSTDDSNISRGSSFSTPRKIPVHPKDTPPVSHQLARISRQGQEHPEWFDFAAVGGEIDSPEAASNYSASLALQEQSGVSAVEEEMASPEKANEDSVHSLAEQSGSAATTMATTHQDDYPSESGFEMKLRPTTNKRPKTVRAPSSSTSKPVKIAVNRDQIGASQGAHVDEPGTSTTQKRDPSGSTRAKSLQVSPGGKEASLASAGSPMNAKVRPDDQRDTSLASGSPHRSKIPLWKDDHDNCHGAHDTMDQDDTEYLSAHEDAEAWDAERILHDINKSSDTSGSFDQRCLSQAAKLEKGRNTPVKTTRFRQKRTSSEEQNSSSDFSNKAHADEVFGVDDSHSEEAIKAFYRLQNSSDSASTVDLAQDSSRAGNDIEKEAPNAGKTDPDGEEYFDAAAAAEIQKFRKLCMQRAMNSKLKRSFATEGTEEDTVTSSAAEDMECTKKNYAGVMLELEKVFDGRNAKPAADTQPASSGQGKGPAATDSKSISEQSIVIGATPLYQVNEDLQEQINRSLRIAAEARESLDVTKLREEIKKLQATADALRLAAERAGYFNGQPQQHSDARPEGNEKSSPPKSSSGIMMEKGNSSSSSSLYPFDESSRSRNKSISRESDEPSGEYQKLSCSSPHHSASSESGNDADDESGFSFEGPVFTPNASGSSTGGTPNQEPCSPDEERPTPFVPTGPPHDEEPLMDEVRRELSLEFKDIEENVEVAGSPATMESMDSQDSASTPKRNNKGKKSITKRLMSALRIRPSPQAREKKLDDSAFRFKSRRQEMLAQVKVKSKVVDQIRRLRGSNRSSAPEPDEEVERSFSSVKLSFSNDSETIAYDFRKTCAPCDSLCSSTTPKQVQAAQKSPGPLSPYESVVTTQPSPEPKKVRANSSLPTQPAAQKQRTPAPTRVTPTMEPFADFNQFERQVKTKEEEKTKGEEQVASSFVADFSKCMSDHSSVVDQSSKEISFESMKSAEDDPDQSSSGEGLLNNQTLDDSLCETALLSADFQKADVLDPHSPPGSFPSAPDTVDFTSEAEDAARQRIQLEDRMLSFLLNGIDAIVQPPPTTAAEATAESPRTATKAQEDKTSKKAKPKEDSTLLSVTPDKSWVNKSGANKSNDTADTTPPMSEACSEIRQERLFSETKTTPPQSAASASARHVKNYVDPGPHAPASPDPHFDQLVESLVRCAIDSDQSDPTVEMPSGSPSDSSEDDTHKTSLNYSEDLTKNSILVETVGFDCEFSIIEESSSIAEIKRPAPVEKPLETSISTARSLPTRSRSLHNITITTTKSVASERPRPRRSKSSRKAKNTSRNLFSDVSSYGRSTSKSISSERTLASERSSFLEATTSFASEGTFSAIRELVGGNLPTIFQVKEQESEMPNTSNMSISEAMSVECVYSAAPKARDHKSNRIASIPEVRTANVSPYSKPAKKTDKSPAGVTEIDSILSQFDTSTVCLESSGFSAYSDESFGNAPRSVGSDEDLNPPDHVDSVLLMKSYQLKRSVTPDRSKRQRQIGARGNITPQSQLSSEDSLIHPYPSNHSGLRIYPDIVDLN